MKKPAKKVKPAIKSVKAWGLLHKDGTLAQNAYDTQWEPMPLAHYGDKVVPVTISLLNGRGKKGKK